MNFTLASNRRFRDSNNKWQEDVCYIGVVAWDKLADSCKDRLKKGSAVLIDGELQSRTWKADDGRNRSIIELKARRIQFLNRSEIPPDVPVPGLVHSDNLGSEDEMAAFVDDSSDDLSTAGGSGDLKFNGHKIRE